MTENNPKEEKFGGTLRFKELMTKLVVNIEKLSNFVREMIIGSIEALAEDNEGLFVELQEKIDDVHKLCDKLENSVVNSVALHQPFASDLRFIISSLKISNEIHRCAHDAVHIAHTSKYFERDMECYVGAVEKVVDLARKALAMYTSSVTYFLDKKAGDIREWRMRDDEIDEMHNKLIDELKGIMRSDCNNINAGVSLILATRYIERIADHACNIVEESTYVVTSKREKIE